LAFVGQCASRKSNVSNQRLRQVRPPRFQQQELGGQHGCGAEAKLSHCWSQPKPIQTLCFALIKAYARGREYSPTQPGWRHPAQPNPPLNGRSNGVPPSLGHRRLLATFSVAQAWRPTVGLPISYTLGGTKDTKPLLRVSANHVGALQNSELRLWSGTARGRWYR
jgi:hypothetical protein